MILIVGAGVTGLTSAACLKGDILVVERDNEVGGYCRTTKRNGFTWDRAGHFFHFKNDHVKSFFDSRIDPERFIQTEKRTSIYFEEYGFIDFPFQKNIHQLPKDVYMDCLIGIYEAQRSEGSYKSFKEFIYATMGQRISDLFLVPYNEKLYACDLDRLDHDAMGRFFPKASFEEVLLNAKQETNSSYNQYFSYPLGGAMEFVDVLKKEAEKNAEIRLNTGVTSIDVEKKSAVLEDGSKVQFEYLINTMPLNNFCRLANIDTEGADLSANKVAVFNLGFNKKTNIDQHWIYYPGDEVFYRVGCYHNIFNDDRASLYVEIGMSQWEAVEEKKLLEDVLKDLTRVGLIDSTFVLVDHEFVVMDPAYVHINSISNAFKEKLKRRLSGSGIFTAGRYGNWTYCSIEDNLLEAVEISRKIGVENISNKVFEFRSII